MEPRRLQPSMFLLSRIQTFVLVACVFLTGVTASTEPAADVAYLQRDGAYWQAWVMAADGSGARAITTSPSEKTRVSWYPDGTALFVCTQDGRAFRVPLNGEPEVEVPLEVRGSVDAVLSPNGKEVAFSVSPARSRDDNEIFVVGVDGSGLRRLTDEVRVQHQPSWHPDGDRVYFVSSSSPSGHDIWEINLASGDRRQMTVGRGLHLDVAVGPDGTLAYSGNHLGSYDLWTHEEGQEPKRLTESQGIDAYPSWSQDSAEILFESTRSGQYEIWSVPAGGGEPRQVTTTPGGARRPAFAPATPSQ